MKIHNTPVQAVAAAFFFIFVLTSFVIGFIPGKQIGLNFISFSIEMLKVLPCAFILVGLFEVWVKKESIEKHFGTTSGFMGYAWSILLAGTSVGGIYVVLPLACSLYNKGAKISFVLTYVGASAICRIPMTIFEASFLGIKFSLIRLLLSIPLVILGSMWLGNYLEKKDYKIKGD